MLSFLAFCKEPFYFHVRATTEGSTVTETVKNQDFLIQVQTII